MKTERNPKISLLWAPWRSVYIERHLRKKTGCIFCRALREKRDRNNHIVKRSRHAFAVLNRYPYTNGHVMIVPNRHIAELKDLTDPERLDLLGLQDQVIELLKEILRPDGFNLGLNLGRAAGAGVLGHVHVHIVPRWIGDTNCMPVISGTKVISQSLCVLYEQLVKRRKRELK